MPLKQCSVFALFVFVFPLDSLSRSLTPFFYLPPQPLPPPFLVSCAAALAPLSLFTSCPLFIHPSLPPVLPSSPSLALSAVQHSDYHSSHRVRPDSQILLSSLLHHLLLEGAAPGRKEAGDGEEGQEGVDGREMEMKRDGE